MILSAGINLWFALYYCGIKDLEQNSYIWSFAMVNALYGALFYIIFSFLLRRWSRGASTTPVKF